MLKKIGGLLHLSLDNEKFVSPGIINKSRAHAIIERYDTDEKVDRAFDRLRDYWERHLSVITLDHPDPRLSRMVNIWNPYQCMVTYHMSRSASYFESGIGRGMGFRDSNQDLGGYVQMISPQARERIIDIASTQFDDGSAYHQYQPLTKRGNAEIGGNFNDDPLWLVITSYSIHYTKLYDDSDQNSNWRYSICQLVTKEIPNG